MAGNWSIICPVNVEQLVQWVQTFDPKHWPTPSGPTKPQRLLAPPMQLVQSVIDQIVPHFPSPVLIHQAMLSRMMPGQNHPMHADNQRGDWITRVHVPIITNPDAWMMFEDEGAPVHFAAGHAYTFNTLARHAFGNNGSADRVHLLFEVARTKG